MTHSALLEELVSNCERFEGYTDDAGDEFEGQECLNDACDMTSTGGYDNDGSVGPELIDNGVQLALSARDYDPNVVIFYAFGEECVDTQCYYAFGKDEEDMMRRVRQALGADFLKALEAAEDDEDDEDDEWEDG
jgi:hypothetical protein